MKTKSGITDKTYSYGFRDNHSPVFRSAPGISVKSIEEISGIKGEPEWMREFRLQAFAIFQKKEMPAWGADLSGIDFQKMIYYVKPVDRMARSWDDVPEEIKQAINNNTQLLNQLGVDSVPFLLLPFRDILCL